MKNLICFLFFMSSFVYADDSLIVLDPLQGKPFSKKTVRFVDQTNREKRIIIPQAVKKAIDGIGRIYQVYEDDMTEEQRKIFGNLELLLPDNNGQFYRVLEKEKIIIGSGFFIPDNNGQPILITNYHVVEPMFANFFRVNGRFYDPDQDWDWSFKSSKINSYVEREDGQRFRITGVRDVSRLMDLAVLEVEDYTGVTLNVADEYSNEVPAYIVGYLKGRDLLKIKATNAFTMNAHRISFMVSHNINECQGLNGISGSPVLNMNGELVGVTAAVASHADCRHVEAIPLEEFNSMNLMSSLKDDRDGIVDLIIEKESLFYDQWVLSTENRKDLAWIMVMFGLDMADSWIPSSISDSVLYFAITSLDEDYLLSIYRKKLFNSGQELDEKEELVYKFLLQRMIAQIHNVDIYKAAQLGHMAARFVFGFSLYHEQRSTNESYQIFQELIQERIPLHLYQLSKLYYEDEDNSSQACRLLTYATEPVEALDDLYQEYECDDVLSET